MTAFTGQGVGQPGNAALAAGPLVALAVGPLLALAAIIGAPGYVGESAARTA